MTVEQLAKAIRRDPDFKQLGLTGASDMDVVLNTCTCPECDFRLTEEEILDYVDRADSLAQFDKLTVWTIKAQCYCNERD